MKAQLTMQYLASFIFFIGLIVYIYFAYSANIPKFIEEVEKEDLRSKAYQISEVLLNDPGHPSDWDRLTDNEIQRIGLSHELFNKTNLVNISKVDRLNFLCSDFKTVQQKLAVDEPFLLYVFNVSQVDGKREQLLSCAPTEFPKKVVNATVKRIFALNNSGDMELAELIIQM